MESGLCRHIQLALKITKPHYAGWSVLRSYSQYNPFFKETFVQKEEVDKMFKEHSETELRAMRYKATESDKTCSIYYDEDVNKMTNYIMRWGKKELARSLLERAFIEIKHAQLRKYNAETNEAAKREICVDPLKIFHAAIQNVTPRLGTKNIKKSGRWYKVPTAIQPKDAKAMGMKWLVEVTKDKGTKDQFYECFARELILASQNEGRAVNKKIELHKLCEANRSYAHYKWC